MTTSLAKVRLCGILAMIVFPMADGLVGCGPAQPEPTLTVVLGHPTAVTITEYRGLKPTAVRTVRVQDGRTVMKLVRELNATRRLSKSGVTVCGNGNGIALFRFRYANGDRWTVHVDISSCPFVFYDGSPEGWASTALLDTIGRLLT